MFTRKVGPTWSPDDEGAGGAGGDGDKAGTQNAGDDGKGGDGGSDTSKAGDAFAALDEDTRGWLQTKGLADVGSLAKSARESEKLLGGMVKLPGKDATPEERDAFLNKLGRPAKADDYQFTVPKDMPEGLPYDGEKAKSFKQMAHKLGLTQAQTTELHDFYIAEQVGAYNGIGEQSKAAMTAKAEAATDVLVKEWGPIDGETARMNFEIANKVFTQTPGGAEMLAELQEIGLVGPNKEILSPAVAKVFAALGTALYTEDGVLRGKPDTIGNPFDRKASGFNLTAAMAIAKEDPDRARSLITAAGSKPSEWGLTA